jgi:hypothetical protein
MYLNNNNNNNESPRCLSLRPSLRPLPSEGGKGGRSPHNNGVRGKRGQIGEGVSLFHLTWKWVGSLLLDKQNCPKKWNDNFVPLKARNPLLFILESYSGKMTPLASLKEPSLNEFFSHVSLLLKCCFSLF